MYLIPTEIKNSSINGQGVFALAKIPQNIIVWKFDPSHDKSLSIEEFNQLDQEAQTELKRVAYLSPTSNKYIYPPEGDPARFTNHSENNNLTVVHNEAMSEEPYFIANKDIEIAKN